VSTPDLIEVHRPPFTISTDADRVDLDAMTALLGRTYWAGDITRETPARAIRGSICFGVYEGATQVGIARVITDHATHAYLADVCILESHRGRGLAKWLMAVILAHPSLQTLRRFDLITRDAHALYARFGFHPIAHPDRHMERR
jgi:GNAT superfamily N-acetyltransferase